VVVGVLAAVTASRGHAEDARKPSPAEKPAPESIEDLRAIEKQVEAVVAKVRAATVGVRVGPAQGSGVIISKDGYVLTAGHVSGKPDREVALIFPDGKSVKGKTLGANPGIDSGLIKITEEGEWPFVEMGKSGDLKRGQWVVALGHPGGFVNGRTPPVRLGRVLGSTAFLVRTDCALVGGDSGGPLFDLEGRVVGIHSRIGGTLTENVHVPVDSFRETWDALVKGEVIGRDSNAAYLGVGGDPDGDECKVANVAAGSPAEKAGLKVGDIVTEFDGKKITSFPELSALVRKHKVGDEVKLTVRREGESVPLKATIGKRPE
jgi:serine protease Do